MICKGQITKELFTRAAKFTTDNDREIFFSYKNDFTPNRLIISGCEGQYNYIANTEHLKGSSVFTLTENDKTKLKVTKNGGLSFKSEVSEFERDLKIKFNIGLGKAQVLILEDKNELASMTIKNKSYILEINDDENPTLMSSILVGVSEVNKLSNILFGI